MPSRLLQMSLQRLLGQQTSSRLPDADSTLDGQPLIILFCDDTSTRLQPMTLSAKFTYLSFNTIQQFEFVTVIFSFRGSSEFPSSGRLIQKRTLIVRRIRSAGPRERKLLSMV